VADDLLLFIEAVLGMAFGGALIAILFIWFRSWLDKRGKEKVKR
jgi:NhaP-type Na+/H+ or K+/H+ antiporter